MFEIDNYDIYEIVNMFAFVLGVIFGGVSQKTQFCFSGAIKDYFFTKSTKRISSVLMAFITAILATHFISMLYDIDLTQSIYFKENINYFSIIIGGALFGIGMVMADGCSSRHLIKFAQGDTRSLVVLIFICIFAFAMTKGILNTPFLYFTSNGLLIELSSYIKNISLNIYVILSLLIVLLFISIRKIKRILVLKDGFIIGLIISAGWYITGVVGADSMDTQINLTSITFVYPSAKTLEFFTHYQILDLSFGVSVILGVLCGAFIMSRFNKKYSFGCTSNLKSSNTLKNSIIGGSLMGTGGVMAIGCTVGQGLTGFSTLAFSSFVAMFSMLSSGYFMAKYLHKRNKLPMCFLFEWNDKK